MIARFYEPEPTGANSASNTGSVMLSDNVLIIAYTGTDNTINYQVGIIDGNSISFFGSYILFGEKTSNRISLNRITSTSFLSTYQDSTTKNIKNIVITVDPDDDYSLSYGEISVDTSITASILFDCVALSPTSFVYTCEDTVMCATISGTTISLGTKTSIPQTPRIMKIVRLSDVKCALVGVYFDDAVNSFSGIVMTVSGTTPSFGGTQQIYNYGTGPTILTTAYVNAIPIDSDKFVLILKEPKFNYNRYGFVCSVSGDTITPGERYIPVMNVEENNDGHSASLVSPEKVMFVNSNSDNYEICTISGTTLSFDEYKSLPFSVNYDVRLNHITGNKAVLTDGKLAVIVDSTPFGVFPTFFK